MGRPCCGLFRCIEALQNNHHRFCLTHFPQHSVCAVNGCSLPVVEKMKTCSTPAHQAMEKMNKARGKAAFTLKDRLKHAQGTEAIPMSEELQEAQDLEEAVQWFEVEGDCVQLFDAGDPGSVGVVDDINEPDPCPSKSDMGNKKIKAQFGRRRTHNEQTLVRPCGIIFARATMFGAEAVSNFLVSECHV